MAKVAITDLLEAGCHFGHQTKRWNPKMKSYVYGSKNGISIIDLTKTMVQIADACNFLQNVVMKGGDILFVGTKRQAQQIILELAERTGMYYVSERWMGGTLTNNVTIRKSIAKMYEIDKMMDSDAARGLKKKELSVMARNAQRLHRDLDGIADMKRLPAALVIVDVCHDNIAVREAKKLNIPIVAICDTNADPEPIDYPIAANDDAVKSIKVITDLFCDAIMVAKEVYQKQIVEAEAAKAAEAKIKAEENADSDAKGARNNNNNNNKSRNRKSDKPAADDAMGQALASQSVTVETAE